MRELVDTIRRLIVDEMERYFAAQEPSKRYGNIAAWDPKRHAVKVTIQPEGIDSNWIPLSSEFIGNGWGMVFGPSVGDQVEIHWPEGGINEASASRRVFDTRNPPPKAAQQAKAGEAYLVAKFGSSFTITHDNSNNESMAHKAQHSYSADAPTANFGADSSTTQTANLGNTSATVNVKGTRINLN